MNANAFGEMNTEDAFDFFNKLSSSNTQQKPSIEQERKASELEIDEGSKEQRHITEQVSRNINWDEGTESIIKRCLLTG